LNVEFQCSSASRKFLNLVRGGLRHRRSRFQCSSASRKFLKHRLRRGEGETPSFSALQRAENSSIEAERFVRWYAHRFSALQRAENSSIDEQAVYVVRNRSCFSALQRAENSSINGWMCDRNPRPCFSALQRAENSSIGTFADRAGQQSAFQCSSASRKFLKEAAKEYRFVLKSFSALQRAENSSS